MNRAVTQVVLIVEDTEPARELLEMALLQVPGVAVRAVGSAEEALRCLASTDIAALVTDLNLPLMDGFELIEAVRARSDIPIMVISGDNDPRTLERLGILGASAYFAKPYSPAQVCRRLEELIHVP